MPIDAVRSNAHALETEIAWFSTILNTRLRLHAKQESCEDITRLEPPPVQDPADSYYGRAIQELQLGGEERLVLVLGLIPFVNAAVLDPLMVRNEVLGRPFTEFGGLCDDRHAGFVPTLETAVFLLAGQNMAARLRLRWILTGQHRLFRGGILSARAGQRDALPGSAPLLVSPEYQEKLIEGGEYKPPIGSDFPAALLETNLGWDDLVLDSLAADMVSDIVAWSEYETTLMSEWELNIRLKPGFRSLFHGPPGTGKTLTASLLGQRLGLPVYRVDLSMVISKYIGETEKNLANLFDQAQGRKWILFFDEADALFGKRTESQNATDRAANQQVSYLLQRIEDFPGLVILASNFRSHIDDAFSRRLQSTIAFRIPDARHRLKLWRGCFHDKPFALADDVDLQALAASHELAGGAIVNILRYACLKAVARPERTVLLEDILTAIRRERQKDGDYGTVA